MQKNDSDISFAGLGHMDTQKDANCNMATLLGRPYKMTDEKIHGTDSSNGGKVSSLDYTNI